MAARTASLAAVAGLCGTLLAAQPRELIDVAGTIQAVNPRAGWYAIVPDDDPETRYAPDRLPDEFRMDGLRVVFSGRLGPEDPNARAWGIPLTLAKIAVERKR